MPRNLQSSRERSLLIRLVLIVGLLPASRLFAQEPGALTSSEASLQKQSAFIADVLDAELTFEVEPARSKIVRTREPVRRIAITDPSVVDVNEFGANEFEVIGLKSGETTLTIWFGEGDNSGNIIRYLVRVSANDSEQIRAEIEYEKLESRLNELMPNSQIQLIAIGDKLIVRGQARDAVEAAQILALLGGQGVTQNNGALATGNVIRLPGAEDLQGKTLVNLLNVPGEHQVMLKVRIAEITRTAARDMGVDFDFLGGELQLTNFIGGAGNLTAILSSSDVNLFMSLFSSHGYGKILAEPNLVTISGQPATFIAGGEFAVPMAVGIGGVAAASAQFKGFGTQLAFTPTVMDKDKIRLRVAPSFSTINQALAVDGIPGLNSRAVATTVDLREGQWLAIAGLIQDEQGGSRSKIPWLGDVPLLGAAFANQNVNRSETELIVLVSPELVHPMEQEQAPKLLPGMDITDPTDSKFFLKQSIEGDPDFDHRSTMWEKYIRDTRSLRRATGGYFILGKHGFSN